MYADHKANKISWQAYSYMKVCLEIRQTGVFPNGQKLSNKDIEDNEQNIFNCTEILNHFGCALPTIETKQEPQLTLF